MTILITGSQGFIGKNLRAELVNRGYCDILEYDINISEELLEEYAQKAEFIFHLAGVNRPQDPAEFMAGNFGFTSRLLELLKKYKNAAPILVSSSTQAELDNPYGQSKKAGEKLIFSHGMETGANVYVYRFPNVFGKWCKPNYNSAVATFCHNTANGLQVVVNDPFVTLNLAYIDDVVVELICALEGKANLQLDGFCAIPTVYTAKLGWIAETIQSFKYSRETLSIPDVGDELTKKLYASYLAYIPGDQFAYPLKMNVDPRGSFTEILKASDRGQFSVNISKPRITKGNHWHHTKNEKFCVVSGKGVVRLRQLNSDKILEYFVSGDKIEIVDIPPGYTHNIENLGNSDLVTFMWASESFDPQKPDTYFLKV